MAEETRLELLPEDWNSALAVVAHPDDLEYGTASAIARWTLQGKRVSYLLVTRGEAGIDSMSPDMAGPLRQNEEIRSAKVVGVDSVEFLNYRDGVIEYGLPLRRDIARVIRRQRPDVIITHNYHLNWRTGALNMADHRNVALASLDASRDAGNRWIFPELTDEGMDPWGGVKLVCVAGSPYPTHGVDVTSTITHGVASLSEHQVYLKNLPGSFDPGTFLRRIGMESGKRLGCDMAVSFEVISI
jgi:LmbE family N-acetylglucosaminyl deacetylase